MAKLLEGRPVAEKIKQEIKIQVRNLKQAPVLASILVGDNPCAASYVKSQEKAALELGIVYKLFQLDKNTTERCLIDSILELNADKAVNGIIVQMPLPQHIDSRKIDEIIQPLKDVEGLHPENTGKLFLNRTRFVSCTASAVMELLNSTGVDLYGKEAVVVGHSQIVGKPLALLLLNKFATVTVCHIGTSKAGKLEEHVKKAEVLIVAVGKAGLIKGGWIKEGSIVVDVGINKAGAKIVGDVEFESAQKRAAYITPVPGGVGPLTVTMLMRNLVEAARLQR
ncbi:MAG: bifunctional 5,10-methylenetetrahydrofolate dehydrogenase/5,10-methenyltetrahydrofolate cyclohydrolase [Candidatus Omnitrophica bacterium]|nr:bifunctional 5,10-methylenetetrahydrofolate dehydrogenase/5,10-methenyltetrahydrofolate cyclohydrolase [Candidatus Omnitrophota bacterium]